MGQTSFAKVKKMESAIEGLKLELGALISDMITPLIEGITNLAGKFGQLDDRTKKIIIVVGTLAALLGPYVTCCSRS